jgi:hypothetical protein
MRFRAGVRVVASARAATVVTPSVVASTVPTSDFLGEAVGLAVALAATLELS